KISPNDLKDKYELWGGGLSNVRCTTDIDEPSVIDDLGEKRPQNNADTQEWQIFLQIHPKQCPVYRANRAYHDGHTDGKPEG
ncbi:hypothetical protein, partial [Pseudomonas sp. SIMBA_021]|uniref:hypothetical protein n=1 Tax=Pseudomonas sp. SIMBA_021 TaxID=3085767 RepID=UPI003978EA9E